MSTDTNLVEHSDRWVLNLRGQRIARVSTDPHLTLSLDSGWDVGVESPALLSNGSVRTNPGLPLTPAAQDMTLQLLGASALSAVAFRSGALRMVFDTGLHLTCPGNSSVWKITGPRGWYFRSAPGGGLTVSPGSGPPHPAS
ncbi:DUF6188 family protein [Kitasatospora cinereorecta]|uniref:DUF6188 family protein n=1 Tax=Kitasatospora cinereorecta TaxID=285560 RepID=A0ABW0V3M3_9ACTN